jgi:hypothetical protein
MNYTCIDAPDGRSTILAYGGAWGNLGNLGNFASSVPYSLPTSVIVLPKGERASLGAVAEEPEKAAEKSRWTVDAQTFSSECCAQCGQLPVWCVCCADARPAPRMATHRSCGDLRAAAAPSAAPAADTMRRSSSTSDLGAPERFGSFSDMKVALMSETRPGAEAARSSSGKESEQAADGQTSRRVAGAAGEGHILQRIVSGEVLEAGGTLRQRFQQQAKDALFSPTLARPAAAASATPPALALEPAGIQKLFKNTRPAKVSAARVQRTRAARARRQSCAVVSAAG